jgi:hypothetical protein
MIKSTVHPESLTAEPDFVNARRKVNIKHITIIKLSVCNIVTYFQQEGTQLKFVTVTMRPVITGPPNMLPHRLAEDPRYGLPPSTQQTCTSLNSHYSNIYTTTRQVIIHDYTHPALSSRYHIYTVNTMQTRIYTELNPIGRLVPVNTGFITGIPGQHLLSVRVWLYALFRTAQINQAECFQLQLIRGKEGVNIFRFVCAQNTQRKMLAAITAALYHDGSDDIENAADRLCQFKNWVMRFSTSTDMVTARNVAATTRNMERAEAAEEGKSITARKVTFTHPDLLQQAQVEAILGDVAFEDFAAIQLPSGRTRYFVTVTTTRQMNYMLDEMVQYRRLNDQHESAV